MGIQKIVISSERVRSLPFSVCSQKLLSTMYVYYTYQAYMEGVSYTMVWLSFAMFSSLVGEGIRGWMGASDR